MLNVTESVNGKFNIVLSDGYRSQLHDRGKGKSDVVTVDPDEKRKKHKENPQLSQLKIKQNKERASHAKRGRPSRVAAKFKGKLPDSSKGRTEDNNNPRHTLQKSGNTASANETPAAFLTKKDLKKLLETLNENDADNASAIQNEGNLSSQGASNKISQLTPDGITGGINFNENFQTSEKPPVEKLERIAPVVAENNPGDNVASTTTVKETIKPIAMRSSFAIGAPGLVTNNPHDDKIAKHRQWVKELEQQIKEKKEREMQVKRDEHVDITHRPTETDREGSSTNRQTSSSQLLKTTAVVTQSPDETDRFSTGHARGRGLISMLSESEADKQRKKILEHQKAIELQVEDRRREKMRERERRLREEAIADERLAKEREKLQKQFEEEMAKTKEKEEQAKRRTQVMQEGIAKAFESAQQLKREKRKNRLQGSTMEVPMESSHEDKIHNGQQTIISDGSSKRHAKDSRHVVPPLNLRTSISSVNQSNGNFSSRLSDPTLNVKRNSLTPVRDVKTSYSEALINKWVNEDFASPSTNNGGLKVNHSCEVLVPFHRTASATLFRESLASQEVHESTNFNDATEHLTDRKVLKKDRSVPEVQPTKTSRLREKGTGCKNLSFTRRPKKPGDARPQQTVQKSEPHTSSQGKSDDQVTNQYATKLSIGLGNETTNIPSHLLATFTPTAHQEKILEQLAALRKGLLMKDREIKTRVFQINEYDVQA